MCPILSYQNIATLTPVMSFIVRCLCGKNATSTQISSFLITFIEVRKNTWGQVTIGKSIDYIPLQLLSFH